MGRASLSAIATGVSQTKRAFTAPNDPDGVTLMEEVKEFLGNIWFALMLVGAVGWGILFGHLFGWYRLPQFKKK